MTTQDSNIVSGSDSKGPGDVSPTRHRIATGEINGAVDKILDGAPTRATVKMALKERESLLQRARRATAALFKSPWGDA